jgi:hypothetical protein
MAAGAMPDVEKKRNLNFEPEFARNLVNLVVKKATLRLPCGCRITRLIEDRKLLSLTLWSKTKLLIGFFFAAKNKKTFTHQSPLNFLSLVADC